MPKDYWIQKAVSKNPGKLHAKLDVPINKKISNTKLEKALNSKNPTLRKEANLAKTLRSFKHK